MKKRRYASANLQIIYIFKKKKKREKWTHTHKSQPGLRMMSHVFVVLFYPLQDMGRGVRAAGHTHTHTHVSYNFAANVQIMAVDVSHHLVVRGGNKIDEK